MAYGIEVFKASDAVNDTIRDVWILEKDDYVFNYHRVEDGKYCVLMGRYGESIRMGDTLLSKSQLERSCKRALDEGNRVFLVPDILYFKFPKNILVFPPKTNNAHKTVPTRKSVRKTVRKTVRRA